MVCLCSEKAKRIRQKYEGLLDEIRQELPDEYEVLPSPWGLRRGQGEVQGGLGGVFLWLCFYLYSIFFTQQISHFKIIF